MSGRRELVPSGEPAPTKSDAVTAHQSRQVLVRDASGACPERSRGRSETSVAEPSTSTAAGGSAERVTLSRRGRAGAWSARERGVERGGRRVECEALHERERLGSTDEAVHAGVLPLDRDRSVVADRVQHAEARLPRHVAVTGRHEVPAATRVRPGEVRTHPPVAAVADLTLRALAVDVIDPVAEVSQETDGVEVLPDEVARVP